MIEAGKDGEVHFRRLLREASLGVAVLDLAGQVEAANPSLREMLHAEAGELEGCWLGDLVHPIYRADVSRMVEGVLTGSVPRAGGEAGLLCRDGTLSWCRLTLFLARTRAGDPEYGLAIVELVPSERKVLDAIHLMATTDDLTGLYNRRGFHLLADQQWRLARRKRRELSLLYLDLDGLKTINDTLGHRAGDEAIRRIAEMLRSACRETDVVARLGGDEFAVLMVEAGEAGVEAVRGRLVDALAAYAATPRRPFPLSVSVGVARLAPGDDATIAEMLAVADRRMYEGKRGRPTSA